MLNNEINKQGDEINKFKNLHEKTGLSYRIENNELKIALEKSESRLIHYKQRLNEKEYNTERDISAYTPRMDRNYSVNSFQ